MAQYRKLELSWNISDFLPVSEKIGRITEYIIPEIEAQLDGETSYWNVPEILLDIRWVYEAADASTTVYAKESRKIYDELAQQVGILTQLLQSYALRHYVYDKRLQDIRKEKELFIEFWDEYKHVIRKARTSAMLTEDEQVELSAAAASLLETKDSQDRKTVTFRENLEQNSYAVRNAFQNILDIADSLRREYTEEKQYIFARSLYSFYTRYLFQPEEKEAGQELLSLNQNIRRLLQNIGQKADTPRTNKWDSQYRDAIWTNLQQLTTHLCVGDQRIIRFQNPREMVEEVAVRMERADIDPNLVRDYRTEQGRHRRCIAMLDANDHQIRILSLSGFLDCDDPELEEYKKSKIKDYQSSREFLKKVQQISIEMNESELAYFSPGVVDRYHCYESDVSDKETMRQVLKDRNRWGIIGSNRACCERKIIAKLESENRTDQIRSGRLILKFSPCKQCEKSLQNWKPYDMVQIVDC